MCVWSLQWNCILYQYCTHYSLWSIYCALPHPLTKAPYCGLELRRTNNFGSMSCILDVEYFWILLSVLDNDLSMFGVWCLMGWKYEIKCKAFNSYYRKKLESTLTKSGMEMEAINWRLMSKYMWGVSGQTRADLAQTTPYADGFRLSSTG